MNNIGELLAARGPSKIHSVNSTDSLFTAVTLMVEMNIGAVLVVDDDVIKGIFTERDYLRFIAREGHSARETPVSENMTSKIIYVTEDATLEAVMATMTEARCRHMPVMCEGRLLGIVSIGDLVKQISVDQKVKLNTLQEYINDAYPGPATHQTRN